MLNPKKKPQSLETLPPPKPSPNRADELRRALTELRLTLTLEQLEVELRDGPPDGDTRLEFLWRLIEPQIRGRRERSVKRRIDEAGFPAARTLEDFDFAFQGGLDRERTMELATLDFVRRGENILLGGMSGTGKSHIAIALGYRACGQGIRTLYTTSASLLTDLHARLAIGALADGVKRYTRPELLIIDEVGLDGTEREKARDAQLLYKAIAPRYDELKSTIVTSNIEWKDWGTYLGDDVATVAIMDRLIHHGHLITIKGPSYRAEQHAKLNRRKVGP